MPESDFTLNELARLYADAVRRLESLAARLEGGQFISKTVFDLYKENVDLAQRNQDSAVAELSREIDSLKDDRKWLVRAVMFFVLMSILGVVFAASGGLPK